MAPTVTAERDTVLGLIDAKVVLHFILSDNASPPIYLENVTVTFTGTAVLPEDHFSLQIDGNILLLTIPSLVLADEGVYKVTVETEAGFDFANTSLIVVGEKNG